MSLVTDLPPYSPLCDVDPAVAIAWYQAYGDHVRARALASAGGSGDSLRGFFDRVGTVYPTRYCGAVGGVAGGDVAGGPVRFLVGHGYAADDDVGRVGRVEGESPEVGANDSRGGTVRRPALDDVGRAGQGCGDGPCDAGPVPDEDGSLGESRSVGRDALGAVPTTPVGGDSLLGGVKSVPVYVAGQLKRGPNFARNQASRERKKQVKAARACGGGSGQLVGERKGFFSSCDEDLQKELRESRAKMLILENKRKEVQYARDVARMQSPAQLALDVVELMRKTQNDSKLGADPRIMGWAKTVVSAEAESVARSAPSSVPSLDSVVLSESEGSRASEYKRRYEELVLAYDNADCFNPGDRADDFRLLKVEFADVVKGDVRTASRFEFAREMQVAIAEAVSGGEYACSRAIETLIGEAMCLDDD